MERQPGRIERAILDSLTFGERERFALDGHRAGAVKVALRASLQTRDAVEEIRSMLRLIVALEERMGSPSAAEALREILRSDPDAIGMIQGRIGAVDEVRRLAAEHRIAAPAVVADEAFPAVSDVRAESTL